MEAEDYFKKRPLLALDCPYTIRKFKTCEGREGQAFSGELLRAGRLVAKFNDAGDGGMMRIDYDTMGADEAALKAYTLEHGYTGDFFDVESFIIELTTVHELVKRYRARCATRLVWTTNTSHLCSVALADINGDLRPWEPLMRTLVANGTAKDPVEYVVNAWVEKYDTKPKSKTKGKK